MYLMQIEIVISSIFYFGFCVRTFWKIGSRKKIHLDYLCIPFDVLWEA